MSIVLVATSIGIMLFALIRYKSVMHLIAEVHYSKNWKLLSALIWFFIAGYSAYGYSLVVGYRFASEHLLILLVFFFGSVYVLLVTLLNHKIFMEIAALNKQAKRYAEHLEEQVRIRTRELEELSITDNLTGLYNQRFFYEKLKEESYRARRQGYQLFLLLFDIDKFKQYNDRNGHLAGDKVIQTVGTVILENIRIGVDSACRYGGDEFTVILPNITEEHAVKVAQRILGELNRQDICASMGLIPCEGCNGKQPRTYLQFADKAMYAAKSEGGNRIKLVRLPDADTPDGNESEGLSALSCI